MKKTLYLTLKKPQFQVTSSGEKNIEYRRPSDWIKTRLMGKTYDLVKFTNGYGSDKPYFICEFQGWSYAQAGSHKYSNGLIVNVTDGYFQIKLGKILEIGNIK
jgi:hypothetical protein